MNSFRLGLLATLVFLGGYGLLVSPVVAGGGSMQQTTLPPMPTLSDAQRTQVYNVMNIINARANGSYQQNNAYYKSMIKALERAAAANRKYRAVIKGVIYRLREQISYSGYQGIDLDPVLVSMTENLIAQINTTTTADDIKEIITTIMAQHSDKKSQAQGLNIGLSTLISQYQKNGDTAMVDTIRSVQSWLITTYIETTTQVTPKPSIYRTLNSIYTYQNQQMDPIAIVFDNAVSYGDISVTFSKEAVSLDTIGVDVLTESVMRKNSSTSLLSVLQNKSIPHKILKVTARISNPSGAAVGISISNLICTDSAEQVHNAQNRRVDSALLATKKTATYSSYLLLNPTESLVSCTAFIAPTDKNGNNIYIQY